jgi:hypothetical protein
MIQAGHEPEPSNKDQRYGSQLRPLKSEQCPISGESRRTSFRSHGNLEGVFPPGTLIVEVSHWKQKVSGLA